MKKNVLRLFSLTLVLAVALSMITFVGADESFELGNIDLFVTVTENGDGYYDVEYFAEMTMVEELAIAASFYREDSRMAGLRFVCSLNSPPVSKLGRVSEGDFEFECAELHGKPIFVFESASINNTTLNITYKINPQLLASLKITSAEDVKTLLMTPMTMAANKTLTDRAMISFLGGFDSSAVVKMEGAGIEKYFGEYSVLAAEGMASADIIRIPVETDPPETDPPVVEPDEPTAEDCSKDNTCPLAIFSDLISTSWYHDGVHYSVVQKLMNGMTSTTFEPDTSVTRAMIATILYRLEGSPAVAGEQVFGDVGTASWFSAPIEWASKFGVANGYDNGNFGPNDPITREQIATMLYRYADKKGYPTIADGELIFTDADQISSWAVSPIKWASKSKLINGYDDLSLRPRGNTRRCEAAVILYRFCNNFVNK